MSQPVDMHISAMILVLHIVDMCSFFFKSVTQCYIAWNFHCGKMKCMISRFISLKVLRELKLLNNQ